MDRMEVDRSFAPRPTELRRTTLRRAGSRSIRLLLTTISIGSAFLCAQTGSAQLAQTVIDGPVGSGSSEFGRTVVFLPNGNFVVSDPDYDLPDAVDVGAVHLYRGTDHALISTLTGSTAYDNVGTSSGTPGITVLPSGHYLVNSPFWHPGGAVTWCDGEIGCSGIVSAANSAIGETYRDDVGDDVRVLGNGKYLIMARWWDDPAGPVMDAGAVRLCDGATGCFGPLAPANSLTGFRWEPVPGGANVVALANDDYVVHSSSWGTPSTPAAGAVTHCSGDTGCVGEVSASNSLVGSASGDRVGMNVVPLSDGNYVVQSPTWNKGAISGAGALTWCSGTTGCPVGAVTAANSLTGASQLDLVGGTSGEGGPIPTPLIPLPGGAYVVESELFNRPGIPVAGAVTWCGAGGAGCTGAVVTTANSLAGSSPLALYSGGFPFNPVVPVGAGAFVVSAPNWTDAGTQAVVGAAVYCDAATHCQGQTISAANALTGSTAGDEVGSSVTALANGNYVVGSPSWTNALLGQVGAATFCDGTTGCQGAVTAANSFVGTNALDQVGSRTTALSNGNYVVASRFARIESLSAAGAVTFCSGTTGCFGAPDAANSLVGTTASDFVGIVHPLPNGNYVVASSLYDEGATASVGAVTWCSGTSGCVGPVGIANSLLGIAAEDRAGSDGVLAFADGRFVVRSGNFDNGSIANAGAISFGDGESALIGRIDETNSVIGSVLRDLHPLGSSGDSSIAYDPVRERFAVGAPGSNRVLLVEVPEPGTGLALVAACGTLGLLSRRRIRSRRADTQTSDGASDVASNVDRRS